MYKQLFLITIILLNSYCVFGQVCGTPHPATPTIYSGSASGRTLGNSEYCIDVFFHIVRNTSGTNAFTPPNTDAIVKELNKFYSSHNIVINNAGSGFVNDDELVNINFSEHNREIENRNSNQTFTNKYGKDNVINYFIVKSIGGILYAGFAVHIPSNSLFIRSDRVLTPISAHELGHCLDLYHTFRGTAANTDGCAEAINGSNCNTCGDLVCDTPADRNQQNPDQTPDLTQGFNPDPTNIMSYYRPRDHFTKGQGKRMRMALDNAPVLSDITSNRCVRMSALSQLVHPNIETVRLSNLP
ncbi:MAG: M43 family zinc metalloprotease, partial [Ekhidna sp.]|nr:M43 family zinc metalloprotease [Ekhidna sp.]